MMWTRNQRHVAAQLFLKRLSLAALLVFAIFAASGVWDVYTKERETAARRAEAETMRSELAMRQDKLRADIETLNSDRGLEATLRAQYGLAERGEGLIVIVDQPTTAPMRATSTPESWLSKLLRWW